MLERPREIWLQALAEADVPSAPVLTTQQFMDLPQVRANGLLQTAEDPVMGNMDQMGLVIDFSETPGRIRMPARSTGQTTDEVLSSLGVIGRHLEIVYRACKRRQESQTAEASARRNESFRL